MRIILSEISMLILASACALTPGAAQAQAASAAFGPGNPFYAPSTLPFHAPPFDKINDSDYQPAIEAGIAQKIEETRAIADNLAAPTFENTFVAMEKSGRLIDRVMGVFNEVTGANINPVLQAVQDAEAPKLAAMQDAIYLNAKLFQRVSKIYEERHSLHLDTESLRLVEYRYQEFVLAGALLSDTDKAALKKLNEEEANLSTAYTSKLLAATKDAAFVTKDKQALAGLSDAQVAAAAQAAVDRKIDGWVLPLQNTTQQPELQLLSNRATRQALFEDSWNRAERGGTNDTRDIIARLAQLRAQKAKLLGYPNHADWKLADQMARTPEAALKFMDALVPAATSKAQGEAKDIQALIDAQHGGFSLAPWDWNFYSEQVRKAKYDLDEAQTRPYFELNNVLHNGVFFAAHELYGITFKQRTDIPVYNPDVQVYEVSDADGKPLALWYCDYFKRDNKNGGAWMDEFVGQSKLLGTLPVVYNVANFAKPAAGEPALISFDDVTTMFTSLATACTACSPTPPIPLFPEPTCPAILSSSPRNSMSIGRAIRRSSSTMRSITKPARRCPRNWPRRSEKQPPSTRDICSPRFWPLRSWICNGTPSSRMRRFRIPMPLKPLRSRRLTCCSAQCRHATAPAIFCTSGAMTMTPATTLTFGVRCWTTMPSSGLKITAG